jgi:hypothetical protein
MTIGCADEVVTLPGGLVLEDGRRLEAVALRALSGYEEDWLARHPAAPSAVAVSLVLGACVTPLDPSLDSGELARRLLVGDRDHLMVQLRRLTLGDTVAAVVDCPSCGEKMDVTCDLAQAPVEAAPQAALFYDVDLSGDRARTVRFRLPTGADQEHILELKHDEAVEALLVRCIIDDGGQLLTPEERESIIAAMERLSPRVEIELDLVCPECSHSFLAPFDPTSFFFAEVRFSHRQLLREVHHLAFHYGWAEAEILGMQRSRRRSYLSLLSDELRRE